MVPAPVCAAQDVMVPVSSKHPSLALCTLHWKGHVGTCSFLTALLGVAASGREDAQVMGAGNCCCSKTCQGSLFGAPGGLC